MQDSWAARTGEGKKGRGYRAEVTSSTATAAESDVLIPVGDSLRSKRMHSYDAARAENG